MSEQLSSVMTSDPVCLETEATVADAARAMRDRDVGDVLVTDGDGSIVGIVTDRDIAVRAVADGADPSTARIGDVCSSDVKTLSPDQSVDDAIALMGEQALRRLPVVEDGRPVGVVSLGDLAIDRDRESVLGQVSAATPNN
jgi:CBS domain-containing protein